MNYTLPSGREVTSEVLLKIVKEDMPALPMACKICPAALWQLTGKPDAPEARCFCRVMHVFTWSRQQQEEILDCDLVYLSEERDEEKQAAKKAKQTEKQERQQRKEEENTALEQRQRNREVQRQAKEAREDRIREERKVEQSTRKEEKAREAAEKAERARIREVKKQQKTNSKKTPEADSTPAIPEAGKPTAMPSFQNWAVQTPPDNAEEGPEQTD